MSSEFLGQGHYVNLLVGMEGGETKDTRVLWNSRTNGIIEREAFWIEWQHIDWCVQSLKMSIIVLMYMCMLCYCFMWILFLHIEETLFYCLETT